MLARYVHGVSGGKALGCSKRQHWEWGIPLPPRKPFCEAKLRIDQDTSAKSVDAGPIALLGDAFQARKLVLASPDLSINQIAKREGRCRKQLTKLYRLSWISPNLVEAIVEGNIPTRLTRRRLLDADLPLAWPAQEELLGLAR